MIEHVYEEKEMGSISRTGSPAHCTKKIKEAKILQHSYIKTM